MLPDDVAGLDTVELGCGTAYVSAWLAQRGARPVAVDPTPGQLTIAAACQAELGLSFPLIQAAGEAVPLPDASFDLAISEYGAAIWADPYRWIPEAARLLRPGGQLIFLGNSSLLMLCVPDLDGEAATEHLRRPQFGMHRFEWPDDPDRRVPPQPRRHDPPAAGQRVRGRGPARAATAPGCTRLAHLRLRHRGVGPALAGRGGVEGPPSVIQPVLAT